MRENLRKWFCNRWTALALIAFPWVYAVGLGQVGR